MGAPNSSGARQGALDRTYRRAALVAAVALVAVTTGVFIKENPFASGYELRAHFASANQLRPGSEVRVAGLRVGEVESIERGPDDSALVTMKINPEGRPIRADARLTVKARLILEGNAYIELRQGSPGGAELTSGDVVPLAQTSVVPQLDQLLDVFVKDVRRSFHRSTSELATGLGGAGTASGFSALRRANRAFAGALGGIEQVARASRGTAPGDLPRAIGASADFAAQLAADPEALADMTTNFNRVAGALAADDRALGASVRGLAEVMRVARGSLPELDAALPSLTAFGDVLAPALERAPATLNRTNAFLDQIAATVRPSELPALLERLEPASRELPRLERRLVTMFEHSTPPSDCIATHAVPTMNMKIVDGIHTTGDPVWLDLMHAFTGLTSIASSVDGNGGTTRAGLAAGEQSVEGVIPGIGHVVGYMPDVQGLRPTWLGYGVDPPYRPDQPCAKQALPDLSKRSGPPPAWDLSPVEEPEETQP